MKRLQILVVGLILVGFVLAMWWKSSPFYHEVRTAATFLELDAPADQVAKVLLDFNKYSEWNPYVVRADAPAPQSRVVVPFQMKIVEASKDGGHSHRVQMTNLTDRGFAWSGSLWPSWLLNWSESFEVIPIDDTHSRVEVLQSYQGVLLRSYWSYQNPKYLAAIKDMGRALKKRVEQHV